MTSKVYAADNLAQGDRIMVGTEILTVDRVSTGTVQRTGEQWAIVYFPDGTGIEFYTDVTWYTTVLNAD